MSVQTLKDDKNNRGENKKEALKSALRTLWLGIRDSNSSLKYNAIIFK